MKNLTWIFLLTLVSFSCKKPYNKNVVNVHAYNVLNDVPIGGVYVSVYKEPNGDLGNTKTVAEGYTGSDGKLTLTYSKVKLFKKFRLYDYFEDSSYEKIVMYLDGNEWNGDGQTGGNKVTDFDIGYAPVCNYKLSLVNMNCFNGNDTLMLTHDNQVTGESTFIQHFIVGLGAMYYSASGCFSKIGTDFFPTNAGNHRYHGYIKRDNGTTNIDTTIYFVPGQDNIIELFF